MTRPRTSSRTGQPWARIASGRVANRPRTRSGVRISVLANTERISASTVSISSRPNRTGRVGRPGIASSLSSTWIRMGTWRRFACDQRADLLQGIDECGGRRPEIDVGNVEYFQAGLLELTVGVRGRDRVPCPDPIKDLSGGRGWRTAPPWDRHTTSSSTWRIPCARIARPAGGGCSRATRPGGGRWRRSAPARSVIRRDVVRVVAADDLNLVQSRLTRQSGSSERRPARRQTATVRPC